MRIFAAIILLVWSGATLAETAVVADGTRANLRSGKTDNYRLIRVLEPGTEIEVLKNEQDYVQVKTARGETGWLPVRLVRIKALPKQVEPPTQLEAVKAELERAQAELKRHQGELRAQPVWLSYAYAVGGLLLGVALGILGLQAYYRKKLNGLRI